MADVAVSTVVLVAAVTAVVVGALAYALVRWRDRRTQVAASGAAKQFLVRYQDPRP